MYPLIDSTSLSTKKAKILAKTGSRANINTALTGVVYRCTDICMNDTKNEAMTALNNIEIISSEFQFR